MPERMPICIYPKPSGESVPCKDETDNRGMKKDRRPRRTGERTGFVLARNDQFLKDGLVANSKWTSELSKASVWETVIAVRKDTGLIEFEGEDEARIEMVSLTKKGKPKELLENSYPLVLGGDDEPVENDEDDDRPMPKVNFEKMLVDLCRDLEQSGYDSERWTFEKWLKESDHMELLEWWVKLKKTDKDRMERLRLSALEKLSSEERLALGLNPEE
jgi:hypothetical protein